MKNKRNTGLRAGIYRETQSTCSQTLLELLSALLIFLAFAAIGYTISGFAAMLWLLGAGALTCIAAAAIRHFKKMKLMLPILLAALLLVVLFARNPLLNGFGAAWNTLRDLWAAEKGILLPLAETDGTGLWLAGIVAGLLLAMMSVAPDKKGEVSGFNFLTGHAGMALGPFAAGALSGWFGYQAVIVASGLILFPLIVYLNYGRKK